MLDAGVGQGVFRSQVCFGARSSVWGGSSGLDFGMFVSLWWPSFCFRGFWRSGVLEDERALELMVLVRCTWVGYPRLTFARETRLLSDTKSFLDKQRDDCATKVEDALQSSGVRFRETIPLFPKLRHVLSHRGQSTQSSPVHLAHTAPYAGVISVTVLPAPQVTVFVIVVLTVSTFGRAEHLYGELAFARPKAPGIWMGWQPGEHSASSALTVEKGPQSGAGEVENL